MGVKSSIFGFLSRLRGTYAAAAPVKPAYNPKLRTDSFYEPYPYEEEDLLPDKPAKAGTPAPAPQVELPKRHEATGLAQFHYLKGPEYPVSSWVVSYGLAEHRDSGEIGMIIGLLSGQTTGVAGHTGGVGLGKGKRLGGYKPIKGNKIIDFWYPGLGESEYASMDAAGSKGEWMDREIVKKKQKYQNLSTGEWGPKARKS